MTAFPVRLYGGPRHGTTMDVPPGPEDPTAPPSMLLFRRPEVVPFSFHAFDPDAPIQPLPAPDPDRYERENDIGTDGRWAYWYAPTDQQS
ncbi:hypothetical protein [Saccharothrix lopnurensis]|uniref:ATP-grasp target RiPP n=1 Tax=Saccharothrix lopnurensis TaxID=1670621 RepID=A0ABW1P6Z7_9PSEU